MLTDEQVIEQVKTLTEAEDARIDKKILPHTWCMLVSHADGPDAYRFEVVLADVSEERVRLLGF